MSNITLNIEHNKSIEKAKIQIQEYLNAADNIIGIKSEWDNNICHISGIVDGTIQILSNSIQINIKIGLLPKIFKNQITKKLQHGIQKALNK